ncbi:MAG: hypothetical protein ACRD21_06615 [Vicinamibacteria bacterium]
MMLKGAAAVLLAFVSQPPDFSGTWRLNAKGSSVDSGAALTGLIGAGAPETLHISQPANGSIVVQSQINESHVRIYTPGQKSSTPVFVGGIGSVTVTTRWEGSTLLSEGRREFSSDASATPTDVKEVIALSADGRTLEIEVTVTGTDGRRTSRMAYTRIGDVGPCESWPTPCKTPSPPK